MMNRLFLTHLALVTIAASSREAAAQSSRGRIGDTNVRVDGSALIVFGPSGESSFPRGLGEARELAAKLGFAFKILRDTAPAWIERSFSDGVYYSSVHPPPGVDAGYIIVPDGGTLEVVPGDVHPMTLHWRMRLALVPEMVRYYLAYWPLVIGIGLISSMTIRRSAANRSTWIKTSVAITAAGALIYAPILLNQASRPENNILLRDVFAALSFAIGLPLLTSFIAWRLIRSQARMAIRVLVPLFLSLAVVAASPIAFLLVHCTSGDCL